MDICKKAEEILSQLSLREKIGQLTQVYYRPGNTENVIQRIKNGEVGSVILCATAFGGSEGEKFSGDNPVGLMQKAAMESKSGIPILFGRDVIHGHDIVLPVPPAMGSSFNFDMVEKAYRNVAEEAKSYGINWTFTPMLDVARDPRWGRMAEGPGEDPYVGSRMARAVVRGFQGTDDKIDMATCAKHFVGYGAAEGGRDYHKTEISDYTLRNTYLPAFRAAIDEGVATVMSAFNEIGGEPVSASRRMLTEVLKEELGFDGFVISDWNAISELDHHGVADGNKDAARLAINAGVDMDMVDNCYHDYLEELVNEGKVSIDKIDDAVLRVLKVKLKMGLFENPLREESYRKPYDKENHLKAARELSRECMVLLKNKDNLLPLNKDGKYAAMGSLMNERKSLIGTWAIDGDLSLVTSFKEAFTNVSDKIKIIEDWYIMTGDVRALAGYDTVILVLGEHELMTGEARSVANIELPPIQVELIRHMKRIGKKVVGVICAGRAMALGNVENALDAIIYAWHGGTETANALCDILFGDYSPRGRLAITIPRQTGQIPIYYGYPPSGRACAGYYGVTANIFYNYEDCLGSPLYPFGYGLDYTNFNYSDIETEKTEFTHTELTKGITISVNVTNIGERDGCEVVQCYIRDVKSSMTRPIKELKATQKVDIASGETKKVSFTLTQKDLGFYNKGGEFVVEAGEFYIYLGENSLTERRITIRID